MNQKQIVLFSLFKDGQVLIEKRPLTGHHGNQLLIPGGSVKEKEAEKLEDALKRELMEELGITPLEFIRLKCEDIYTYKGVVMIPFLVNRWEGEIPSIGLDPEDPYPLEWVSLEVILNSPINSTKKVACALQKYVESSFQKETKR